MADAERMCANIPEPYRAHAVELVTQLDFMQGRLAESRKHLAEAPIIMAYDNGGGQKGIRKNPAFDAYSQLMRTYTRTLSELRELLGNGAARQPQLVKFENFAKTMKKVSAD